MHKIDLIIRTENQLNYNWFKKGIGDNFNLSFNKIPNPGDPDFLNLPEKLKNILRLDKPDLIISKRYQNIETPILSIEITKSKPASQHIEQRIPRIIAAAESDVCSIYICPKKISGHQYNFQKKHYDLLNKISKINKVPAVFYHYSNTNDFLKDENGCPGCPDLSHNEMSQMFTLINDFIIHDEKKYYDTYYNVFDCVSWKDKCEQQKLEADKNSYHISSLQTCEELDTKELESFLINYQELSDNWVSKTIKNLPSRIINRKKTLIFRPKTTKSRIFEHAGDPYVGMLGSFDYAFCRVGRSVEERKMNLVYMPLNKDDSYLAKVMAPEGYKKYYEKNCPFKNTELKNYESQFKISHNLQYGCTYAKQKPLRIYGYFCDMMIFKDGTLVF